jgi:hypothetical protein
MRFFLSAIVLFGSSLVHAEDDLSKAFQSEYVYLASQKEALARQKIQMEQSYVKRTADAKARVLKLQKEVSRITAQNDEKHESLLELERMKKELSRRGTSLESTFKKASKSIADAEKGLRFESNKDKVEIIPPLEMKMSHLGPIFKRADELLRASSRSETYEGFYLNAEDKLSQGKVTRLGRVAAFVNDQKGDLMLGPNGSGSLKALDLASGASVFVFDNMNEAARLQRPATVIERIADMGPLLFLGLMLLMVAGLFFVLIKI